MTSAATLADARHCVGDGERMTDTVPRASASGVTPPRGAPAQERADEIAETSVPTTAYNPLQLDGISTKT
jgi:hypothetical protein